VPYVLQHSASNMLRAADTKQLDKFKTIRFHISIIPSDTVDNLGNYSNNVQLEVFDVAGKSVAVLVNESKPAGAYQARFEAREMAGGVYFYRLQAGAFVASPKMVLVR
jgi:hypothetical protein